MDWSTIDVSFAARDLRPGGGAAGRDWCVPDHPSVRALFRAVMAAGPAASANGWRAAPGGPAIVERVGLDTVRLVMTETPDKPAWPALGALSALALDTLIVLIDCACRGEGELLLLRAEDVLEAKGCRRFGAERMALQEQIYDELTTLSRLRLGGADGPLFRAVPVGGRPAAMLCRVAPALLSAWRRATWRTLNDEILRFDHRQNRGAEVLAKKLAIEFSLSGATGGVTARNVETLVKAVGAAHELTVGARAGRLIDRFQEAVLRLDERGLFQIDYRRRHSALADADRVKGWVRQWREADLLIQPHAPREPVAETVLPFALANPQRVMTTPARFVS